MRAPLTIAIIFAALPFQAGAQALTQTQRFDSAKAVVLVEVLESSYPSPGVAAKAYLGALMTGTAKLRVVRSWKGPYPAGAIITAGPEQICAGLCPVYPFQFGQEVIVFIGDLAEPIHPHEESVLEGSPVEQAAKELDALAVKAGT
jgi:hypothetical protein